MPLSDQYLRVPLDKITVLRDDRQRTVVETDDLQKSIKQIGLINPIVVRQDEDRLILVAGERRLTAFNVLNAKEPNGGYATVPVRFADDLTLVEAAIIELEENIKRRDLPWQDQVKAVAKLHNLHADADPDWNQARTCEVLSMTSSTISIYLKIEPHLDDSRIAGCPTVRNAYDVLERRSARARVIMTRELFEGGGKSDEEEEEEYFEGDEEFEFEEEESKSPSDVLSANDIEVVDGKLIIRGSPEVERVPITVYGDNGKAKKRVKAAPLNLAEDIIHGSFLEWAPTYSKRRFDFIHCDFPYGIVELGPQMQGNEHGYYEDSPELYMQLLDCLCTNLDKLLSANGWIMFWYTERMGQVTRDTLKYKAPSLNVQVNPLIWVHSDNAGISPDHRRRPRHIYDTALLMHRGEDIQLIKLKSDAYSCHTDHKLHPSTKPEPMLRYFFEMFVDNNTCLLDPTCGSGAALRAAESLHAKQVLGIEQDWEYCEAARAALKESRKKAELISQIGAFGRATKPSESEGDEA